MKAFIVFLIAAQLISAAFAQEHLGLRWAYSMRISVAYDLVPGQRLSAPSCRSVHPPEYPVEAMRAGLSGETRVTFLLKEDGLVYEAKVSSSSGIDLLDAASLTAVKNWKFHRFGEEVAPGRIANRYSTPVTVEAVIKYELPEG